MARIWVFFIFIGFINCFAAAFEGSGEPGHQQPKEVISNLIEQNRLVMMGEATHDDVPQYVLLNNILETSECQLDYLGFEIEAQHQKFLDTYLKVGGALPEDLAPTRIASPEVKTEFQRTLDIVRNINLECKTKKKSPIRVIALDMPKTDNMVQWFQKRDEFMYDRLLELTNGLSGKGIVFAGAAHLSKHKFPYPKQLAALGITGDLENLGYKLNDLEELEGKMVRIWIQPPLNSTDFDFIPSELKGLYRIVDWLDPNIDSFAISTQDQKFKTAQDAAGVTNETPLNIERNFDIFVKLGSE